MSNGDEENTNIEDILNQIKGLQDTEQSLMTQLDTAASSPGFNSSDPEITTLLSNINNISETRKTLFEAVSDKLAVLQEGVSDSRVNLVGQLTLLKVAESQLNDAKTKMSSLENRNDTKMRLVQINTYYGKRYEFQSKLMQKIIMVCIPLLILFILKKKSMIPELISNYAIGITIAVGAIFIIRNMWDIYTRSNMNFDEYDWKYEDPSKSAPSIWQYNKDNLLKIDNPLKTLMKNLGICVGDDCCADGLYFDKEKQKCVIPSDLPNAKSTRDRQVIADTAAAAAAATPETFITKKQAELANAAAGGTSEGFKSGHLKASTVADYGDDDDETSDNNIKPFSQEFDFVPVA